MCVPSAVLNDLAEDVGGLWVRDISINNWEYISANERDPDGVPTVALALGGGDGRCGIWINDGDFLGCGLPTWTTDTLLAHLRYIDRMGR